MSDQTILLVGGFCFSMMLIGLGLTAWEFRRKLDKKKRERSRGQAANDS